MPESVLSLAERLHFALVSAYDQGSLTVMLGTHVRERLDVIVPASGTFDTTVFHVVRWAEQHGRTGELVRAFVLSRPYRADARDLLAELTGEAVPAAAPPPPAPVGDALSQVVTLVGAFERIRKVMPEGDERTVLMERLVTEARSLPLGDLDLPARYHLSTVEGERLAAAVALRERPDPAYLRWLAERIPVEYAFCGYQAAVALREAASRLPAAQIGDAHDAVNLALLWLDTKRPNGRPRGRARVLEEAQAVLIRRTARTT